MRVEWYGQSALRLEAPEATVFIDPFGDVSPMASRGIHFEYPAIQGVSADLVLVTHDHLDHNAVEVIEGDPVVLRSTAGRLGSPAGEVTAVASEHDAAAGTERGPNTIFVFTLEGIRVAHFGDFGQATLRDVVPMHYRTPKIGFLDPVDPFLERMPHVKRVDETAFDTASLDGGAPLVVVPAVP